VNCHRLNAGKISDYLITGCCHNTDEAQMKMAEIMETEFARFARWLLDRDIHGEDNGDRMTINLEIEVDAHHDTMAAKVEAVLTEYERSKIWKTTK
jgi:hypothetical protein